MITTNFKLKPIRILLSILVILVSIPTFAEVTLPSVFTDNLVLQQKSEANLWGWANAGEKITITTSWGENKLVVTDAKGNWVAKLKTPKGSYNAEQISIKAENEITLNNILIGEVWLCSGQSNMGWSVSQSDNADEEIANASYPNMRFFHVPNVMAWEPQIDVDAKWEACSPETVAKKSAAAYFFGRKLLKELDVPIGLIVSAWGASDVQAWIERGNMKKEGFQDIVDWYDEHEKEFKEKRKIYVDGIAKWKAKQKEGEKPDFSTRPKRELPGDQHIPFALYNGMIHPIKTYTMQGAIWYQGESNVPRANQYRTLFPAFIRSWRNIWEQGDFPFYFVQIAPFHYKDSLGVNSAELRDAQLKTLNLVKNTGMVVATDISKADNIHPRNKQDIGLRLAMLALKYDYKKIKGNASSAFYKSHQIVGNKIIIKFDHAEKLKAKGNKIVGFTIAGNDQKFVEANAKIINGNQIEVWSDKIDQPKSVRLGWTNAFTSNIFNEIDLPVSPFKTDDWEDVTKGIKFREY